MKPRLFYLSKNKKKKQKKKQVTILTRLFCYRRQLCSYAYTTRLPRRPMVFSALLVYRSSFTSERFGRKQHYFIDWRRPSLFEHQWGDGRNLGNGRCCAVKLSEVVKERESFNCPIGW
ncbi:hypothetical protein EYC80_002520 [Monilinia laxa]|uniref:Uncharacterized protein n=1 Tax=Monilinia laxa TaxID=61186 RepID=A0A5N6K494_MONLA|nr:hypothetical protein EYC80_002520 [Monilinia laxa]